MLKDKVAIVTGSPAASVWQPRKCWLGRRAVVLADINEARSRLFPRKSAQTRLRLTSARERVVGNWPIMR